jgi:hypothetical protein
MVARCWLLLIAGMMSLASEAAVAEPPTIKNISGRWYFKSYLIDPASEVTDGDNMPISLARIWTQGEINFTEKEGEAEDAITGKLVTKLKLELDVKGRRVPGQNGRADAFVLTGTAKIPASAGRPDVALKYHIEGIPSAGWTKGAPPISLRGLIQAQGFDPWAPTHTVGAFVLTPLEVPAIGGGN